MGEKADLLRKLHALEQLLAPGPQRDAITKSISVLVGVPRGAPEPVGQLIPEESPRRGRPKGSKNRPKGSPKAERTPYTDVKPPGAAETRGPSIHEGLRPVGTFDPRWHQAIDGLMAMADDFSEEKWKREKARKVLHDLGIGMPRKDSADVSYPVYNRVKHTTGDASSLIVQISYDGSGRHHR